jgi:hypothetical protein
MKQAMEYLTVGDSLWKYSFQRTLNGSWISNFPRFCIRRAARAGHFILRFQTNTNKQKMITL